LCITIFYNLFYYYYFIFYREVINKENYGKETDCWSYGCILYALITGSPPFESANIQEIIKKMQKGNIEFPVDK